MQTTLLSTKLYIPRSQGAVVPRPRLADRVRPIERLDAGLRGKLTLVSAPAGYGKTTLVSERTEYVRWIHGRGTDASPRRRGADRVRPTAVIPPAGATTAPLRVAWLSLDASDNDLARFLSYLIAALQQIDPGIGTDLQPIADRVRPLEPGADLAVEQLLTALINDIAASGSAPTVSPSAEREGFALIMDDYHVIRALEIHQALDFLLDHLPPAGATTAPLLEGCTWCSSRARTRRCRWGGYASNGS